MLTKHLGTNDAICAGRCHPRWACASKRRQGIGFVLSAVAIGDRVEASGFLFIVEVASDRAVSRVKVCVS